MIEKNEYIYGMPTRRKYDMVEDEAKELIQTGIYFKFLMDNEFLKDRTINIDEWLERDLRSIDLNEEGKEFVNFSIEAFNGALGWYKADEGRLLRLLQRKLNAFNEKRDN